MPHVNSLLFLVISSNMSPEITGSRFVASYRSCTKFAFSLLHLGCFINIHKANIKNISSHSELQPSRVVPLCRQIHVRSWSSMRDLADIKLSVMVSHSKSRK